MIHLDKKTALHAHNMFKYINKYLGRNGHIGPYKQMH